jgi:predicted nucleic-acid-binding Zn-ribbon protein
MRITEEEKQRIIKVMEERGATYPCPRCGNTILKLLDAYFDEFIQTEFTGPVPGGPSIPSAVMACVQCGYLMQHSLEILGLIPKQTVTHK